MCLPTLLGSRWGARPIHASPEPAGTPTLPPQQSVTGAPAPFFKLNLLAQRLVQPGVNLSKDLLGVASGRRHPTTGRQGKGDGGAAC